MFTHDQVWSAIDRLAREQRLTASGLARRAGLDATTFNPSKRSTPDGHRRWPSTESIAKILEATRTSFSDFVGLIENEKPLPQQRRIPLIGLAQAGAGGFFDDVGQPAGSGWDEIEFPAGQATCKVYAMEITGDSMLPLYRDGDRIIVSPAEPRRRGDRVVVRTTDGEVMAKVLMRQTASSVELHSINPDHPPRTLAIGEIDWMARIVWASQ